jgi:ABC-2 type transport system ATP-binding protein
MNLIEVADLRKTYRSGGGEMKEAVRDVSFTIAASEIVGYAGPNGAGKSSTIKMLTGVLAPTSGTARVLSMTPWTDRRRLMRRVGVVYGQRTSLWEDLRMRDAFEVVRRLYRIPADEGERRLRPLVEALGLHGQLGQRSRTLSLGERTKANLAAALLPAPEILFLDEPTIGLDLEARLAVREVLKDYNERSGTTILLTTHDLGDMTALCHRLIIIDKGKAVYDGTFAELAKAFDARRVIVVDLRQPPQDIRLAHTRVLRQQSHRFWLELAGQATAAHAIAELLDRFDVADIAIEEPALESLLSRIYRGELAPNRPMSPAQP